MPGIHSALSITQRREDICDIPVDAHGSVLNLCRAADLAHVEAGIESVSVFLRVLPEQILDDDRRVSLMLASETFTAFSASSNWLCLVSAAHLHQQYGFMALW